MRRVSPTRRGWTLLALCGAWLALCACRRETDSFRTERIPPGAGWSCWTGRCHRSCQGLPGPPDASGVAPEPVCATPLTAHCITYEVGERFEREPEWACFDSRAACEATQRSYLRQAQAGEGYAAVSPCTERP